MVRNELPYSKEEYYVGAQGNPELNIDITANGDYDVRKYATAKVNVSGGGGGGDITTAKLTVVDAGSLEEIIRVPYLSEGIAHANFPHVMSEETTDTFGTKDIVLYKGTCHCIIGNPNANYTCSGDIEELADPGTFKITGDCTITTA